MPSEWKIRRCEHYELYGLGGFELPCGYYQRNGFNNGDVMWENILAWIIEKVLGATWHRFFPPKTSESEERKEASEIQKPATGSDDSIIGKL